MLYESVSSADYDTTAQSMLRFGNGNDDDVSTSYGGIAVDRIANAIVLFGAVNHAFQLNPPLNVTKFTTASVELSSISSSDSVSVCLHELISQVQHDNSTCVTLDEGVNEINLGGTMFDYKSAQANFISFVQTNSDPRAGESKISGISIRQLMIQSLLDDEGYCRDIHAYTTDDSSCICNDGYVSSNGGKEIGIYDTCVECEGSPVCVFDGGLCDSDRDCFQGRCVDGSCSSKVSVMMI